MSRLIIFPPKLAASDLSQLEPKAYTRYQKDFGPPSSPVPFRGAQIGVERHPHRANATREHTYWHMVTEGFPESIRTSPIWDRLERVPWVRVVLENAQHADIKFWANARGSDQHFCLWHSKLNFIVVVKQTAQSYLLKTCYCPDRDRVRKLHIEYARSRPRP